MICPVCKIWYDETNDKMFDHIKICKGRKDIITTRWYKKEDLISKNLKSRKPSITIDTTFRPVTR